MTSNLYGFTVKTEMARQKFLIISTEKTQGYQENNSVTQRNDSRLLMRGTYREPYFSDVIAQENPTIIHTENRTQQSFGPEFWINLAQIFALPITVTIVILLLRPFIKSLIQRLTHDDVLGSGFTVELRGLQEVKEELEQLRSDSYANGTIDEPSGDQAYTTFDSRRLIAESLAEGSKEKLERIRLALESEQVTQLIQYHVLSLAQSRISFWFSIGAGTLGFCVILIGAIAAILGGSIYYAIIPVISGAIIDAVAVLFFTQSNQARRLMTVFFDKLREDRKFNESLRLCNSISDITVQSNLKAHLSLFFAGIPHNEISGEEYMRKHQEKQEHSKGSLDTSPPDT